MANESAPPPPAAETALLARKLGLFRAIFEITQQELLLVELEGLTPLLQRKGTLIDEINRIDETLATFAGGAVDASQVEEISELVHAILENERTLETRINEEHSQLRKEMRELDQQTRLKEYLERQRQTESKFNLKK